MVILSGAMVLGGLLVHLNFGLVLFRSFFNSLSSFRFRLNFDIDFSVFLTVSFSGTSLSDCESVLRPASLFGWSKSFTITVKKHG